MIQRMSTAEKAASAPVPISAPAMPCSTWILVPKPKNPIAPITVATSPTSPALAADHRNTAMRKTIRASGAVATKAAIQGSAFYDQGEHQLREQSALSSSRVAVVWFRLGNPPIVLEARSDDTATGGHAQSHECTSR